MINMSRNVYTGTDTIMSFLKNYVLAGNNIMKCKSIFVTTVLFL